MEPKIIDKNFLNQEEIEDITTKVFALKDHWKGINANLENDTLLISRVLPPAVYSKYFSEQEIPNNNKIMFENFSYYYDKIKNKLSSHFNVPIKYSPSLQYPGFHIFLNNNGNEKVSKPIVNFHNDRFPTLSNILPMGTIHSVIIPITLPSSGGYLLYDDSGYRDNLHKHKPRMITDKVFKYNTGMMATWSGELIHSIGPFVLMNSLESRITMQMHINLESDRGTIFW